MKKLLSLILCLILCLSLAFTMAACGEVDKEEDKETSKEEEKTPEELLQGTWYLEYGSEELGINAKSFFEGGDVSESDIPELSFKMIFEFTADGKMNVSIDKDSFSNMKNVLTDAMKKNADKLGTTAEEIDTLMDGLYDVDDMCDLINTSADYKVEGDKIITTDEHGITEEMNFSVTATSLTLTDDLGTKLELKK